MTMLAFYLYGGVQLVLFVLAVRLFLKQRRAVDLFLCLSSAGLVYDNLIIGSGQMIGEGGTLMALNAGRFILHALTTPLLAILGLALARNAKVEWAWTRKAQITYCLIATLCVAYGVYADAIALRLEPNTLQGVLRYTNVAAKGPPLAAITTMTLLLFLGISVFVKSKWPWLLVSSIVMFTVAAFASSLALLANLGEIVLIAGLVLTSRRFPYLSKSEFASSQTSLSIVQKTELAEQVRERKRKLANWNRSMAWVMFPMLVIGTIAYYRHSLGLDGIPSWVSDVFNNGFIVLFFIHAAASFYFYGIPKTKANIRVAHVYIGYSVFLFTMISQSFRAEPLHIITYLINWVVIGAHVTLSTRFMLKRVMNRKQDPLLEFAIGKKFALDK